VTLEARLANGLSALATETTPAMRKQLVGYLELLARWNRQFNLTAVRDVEQMVSRHLLDSLSVVPYILGDSILDVGTGAGLPGIPLAIVCPERRFDLLDSNGKKIRFVRQVAQALGLQNVRVHHERVEAFHPTTKFDTLIARALAALPDLIARCAHLLGPDTRFLAMKGKLTTTELSAVPPGFKVTGVARLDVPGLGAERHLVLIQREQTD